MLNVCANLWALALWQTIHAYLLKTSIAADIAIAITLLDLYAKIGELKSAEKIFHSLQKKDVVMWTSMINGLAMHGHGYEALSLFQKLQKETKLILDHITNLGALFACNHNGLVQKAKKYFNSMILVYGILLKWEHYGCMVDLLS